MRVDWLSLVDFRSYSQLDWTPAPGVNVLVGDNGAGKTNLLEAIAYLGTLKSFRSSPESALVSLDADSAIIRAGVGVVDRERLIEIEIPMRGPRRSQIDKKRLARSADLLGVIKVVAFLPDDLDLVKRGPAHRRQLLDDVAVQLWPAASNEQAEYERALRQRNAFLRNGARDDATLSVWDSRLSQAGGRVIARRANVIAMLEPVLALAYEEIAGTGPEVGISYLSSWSDQPLSPASAAEHAAGIDEALERSRRLDYERRMTTLGPHRDEPRFTIGLREARTHASQGEQRSIALATKIATHRVIRETIGVEPVLLLDDVFSELDRHRAEALAKSLPSDTQTIITTARPEDIPVSGRTFEVEGGRVR